MTTREAKLARTFVEVADTLVADFDLVDLHTLVVNRCVEIFGVDAAGVLITGPGGELRVVAATSEAARALELFELQAEEGPSLDCLRTGQQVVNADLADLSNQWPDFSVAARAHGFRTAYALPLRLRDEVIGALSLFLGTGLLDESSIDSAQALADIATIAILHHRASVDAQTLNEQLDQALTSRVVIEQAKGMLMAREDTTLDEAFQLMRGYARATNKRLADVARDLVAGSLTRSDLEAPPSHIE